MLKKLLIGLAVVVVIIIATIIAIPFFVPLDTIRERIVAEVKTATGRDLAISGPLDLSVFPSVALELADVSFSNMPGAERPSMITLGQLDIEVALLPLLSSEIVVQRLILREPVISLEIDQTGRPNWVFDTKDGGSASAPAAPTGTGAEPAASDGGIGLSDLRLGEVGVIDGTILYTDRRSGQSFEATKLGLDIELESLDSALALSGGLDFQGRGVKFGLGADRPRAFVAGGDSSLNASFSADAVTLTLDGGMNSTDAPELTGKLALSIPSIADLADWLAIDLSEGGIPIDTVALESELSASPASIKLQTATLTVDDIAASGDLAIALDGPRPAVFGRLAVDQLNLDPFLGAGDAAEATDGAETAEAGATATDAGGDWSDDPIDLSALLLADADLVVASEGVTLRGIEAGPSVLTTMLKDGVLDFELSRTSLFGGHVALQFGADAAARTPSIRAGVQVDEVQVEPVLANFAEFDRLTGATTAEFALSSAGRSQRALVEALDGTGSVVFRDGSIKGINIAAIVRNLTSTDPTADETLPTDFAELGATFQITDGIAHSEDIRLLAPLLRIEGAGDVALPRRALALRLAVKLVADAEGQGGAIESAGLAIPLLIEGPFDDLSYGLDPEGLITNVLQDPGAAREQLEGLVDQLQNSTGGISGEDAARNLLEGLIGGTPPTQPAGEEAPTPAPAPNPADALRSILGR